jgi:hypothetical protein
MHKAGRHIYGSNRDLPKFHLHPPPCGFRLKNEVRRSHERGD